MGAMEASAATASTGVEDEQQRRAPHQHDGRGGELNHAGAHEGPHLLDVVGEPGEELARLGLVVIAEAQPLDAREERVAQVEGDALGDALGQVALEEVEESAAHGDGHQSAHGREHRGVVAPGDAAVDGQPHHQGRGEVGGGDEQERHQGARRLQLVPAQISECPPDGLPAARGSPGSSSVFHVRTDVPKRPPGRNAPCRKVTECLTLPEGERSDAPP